jgi:hypothetical protein
MIPKTNSVRGFLMSLAALFTLIGCSTLPPAKPINDLAGIAGTWKGTLSMRSGSEPGTLTISPDGKYTSERTSGKSSGSLSLKEGKAVTDRGTIYTLHEGEGKRILTTASSNASGEFAQVK